MHNGRAIDALSTSQTLLTELLFVAERVELLAELYVQQLTRAAVDHQLSVHQPLLSSTASLRALSTPSHHAPLQDLPLVSSLLRALLIASDHPCFWAPGSP